MNVLQQYISTGLSALLISSIGINSVRAEDSDIKVAVEDAAIGQVEGEIFTNTASVLLNGMLSAPDALISKSTKNFIRGNFDQVLTRIQLSATRTLAQRASNFTQNFVAGVIVDATASVISDMIVSQNGGQWENVVAAGIFESGLKSTGNYILSGGNLGTFAVSQAIMTTQTLVSVRVEISSALSATEQADLAELRAQLAETRQRVVMAQLRGERFEVIQREFLIDLEGIEAAASEMGGRFFQSADFERLAKELISTTSQDIVDRYNEADSFLKTAQATSAQVNVEIEKFITAYEGSLNATCANIGYCSGNVYSDPNRVSFNTELDSFETIVSNTDNSDLNNQSTVVIAINSEPNNGEPVESEQPTGPTQEEIDEAERQEEADRLEAERLAAIAEANRLAAISDLIIQRNGFSITQQDAELRLQDREDKLDTIQFGDLQEVQNAASLVGTRINELRTELNNTGLNATRQQFFQDLLAYQVVLENEQDRIAADIARTQQEIASLEVTLSSVNGQLDANENSLAALGENLSGYVEPNFSPGELTDWTNYEYELPAFNETEVTEPDPEPEVEPEPEPEPDPETVAKLGFITAAKASLTSTYLVTKGATATVTVDGSANPVLSSGDGITITADTPTAESYQYLSWGTFSRSIPRRDSETGITHTLENVRWLYGDATPASYFEGKSGTASWAGNIYGDYALDGTNQTFYDAVTGDVSFTVDFSDNSVLGQLTPSINYELTENTSVSSVAFQELEGSFALGDINGQSAAGISTAINTGFGGQEIGKLDGIFFGPNAEEFGGTFYFRDDSGGASGIVVAQETEDVIIPPAEGPVRTFISTVAVNAPNWAFLVREGFAQSIHDVAEIPVLTGNGATNDPVITSGSQSQGYSYIHFGDSRQNNAFINGGVDYVAPTSLWLYGTYTTPEQLNLRSGTASYAGELFGHAHDVKEPDLQVLTSGVTGNFQLSMNFANGDASLSGMVNGLGSEPLSFSGTSDGAYSNSNTGRGAVISDFTDVGLIGINTQANLGFPVTLDVDGRPARSQDDGFFYGSFSGEDASEFGGLFAFALDDTLATGYAAAKLELPNVVPDPSKDYSNYRGFTSYSYLILDSNEGSSRTLRDFETVIGVQANGDISVANTNNLPNVSDPDADGGGLQFVENDRKYNYVEWGDWSQVGQLTTDITVDGEVRKKLGAQWLIFEPTSDLRRQGYASYEGEVRGSRTLPDDRLRTGVSGQIGLEADFVNDRVTGSMSLESNGTGWAEVTFDTDIRRDSDSSGFQGALAGSDVNTGVIFGGFAGPTGEEIGGGWELDHTNGQNANGIFRANEIMEK